MSWNQFITGLVLEKRNGVSTAEVSTRDKRKAEDSIVLRLKLLFDSDLGVKKISEKYYIDRIFKRDLETLSEEDISVEVELEADEWNNAKYNKPRIRQVFWEFIENILRSPKNITEQYEQIYEFLLRIITGPFVSKQERTEYIKMFFESFCGKNTKLKKLFVGNPYGDIPPMFSSKEISELALHSEMGDLFSAFEICLDAVESDMLTRVDHIALFENSSETAKRLYRLLYLEFPRQLEDARGQHYGNFDVLKAIKNKQWERFSFDLRLELLNCLEELEEKECEIYAFLKEDNKYKIEHMMKTLRLGIEDPMSYQIIRDINILQTIFQNDIKTIENKIGKMSLEYFQKDLTRLITKYFGDVGQSLYER